MRGPNRPHVGHAPCSIGREVSDGITQQHGPAPIEVREEQAPDAAIGDGRARVGLDHLEQIPLGGRHVVRTTFGALDHRALHLREPVAVLDLDGRRTQPFEARPQVAAHARGAWLAGHEREPDGREVGPELLRSADQRAQVARDAPQDRHSLFRGEADDLSVDR